MDTSRHGFRSCIIGRPSRWTPKHIEAFRPYILTMNLDTDIQLTMESGLKTSLSAWAIVAIVCNSVVGVLVLILFVVLYKACKVPSKAPVLTPIQDLQRGEQKYLLTAA